VLRRLLRLLRRPRRLRLRWYGGDGDGREPGALFLSGVIVALSRKYFGPAARLAARV